MTLALYRIDDRLIHGQVVVGWGQPLDVEFIVLVDDEVAGSGWEQELYRMGVPPEMEVYFHDVATAAAKLADYERDSRTGILLVGDIATMRRLRDATAGGIPRVNIGGIHYRGGRTQKLRYVFLSDEESEGLRALAAAGTEVTAQDVPASRPISLDDVLEGRENG